MSAVSLFFPQETLPHGMTKWLSQWLPQSLFTCLTCPPTSVLEKFTRLHFFCSLERQHGAELKAQPWEAQWTNVHYRPYNDHQQNLGQVPWPLYVSVSSSMTLAWWRWWWQRWEGKHLPPRILAGIQWWKVCKALRTLRRTCVIWWCCYYQHSWFFHACGRQGSSPRLAVRLSWLQSTRPGWNETYGLISQGWMWSLEFKPKLSQSLTSLLACRETLGFWFSVFLPVKWG